MCALTIDLPADEFQEQVVAQAARQMLQRYVYDEDGNQGVTSSELARRIENTIRFVAEARRRGIRLHDVAVRAMLAAAYRVDAQSEGAEPGCVCKGKGVIVPPENLPLRSEFCVCRYGRLLAESDDLAAELNEARAEVERLQNTIDRQKLNSPPSAAVPLSTEVLREPSSALMALMMGALLDEAQAKARLLDLADHLDAQHSPSSLDEKGEGCRCKTAPNREAAMVEAAPGAWCDPCIAPLVKALNAGDVATVASCCGHGERHGRISLADGRELLIFPGLEASDPAALPREFPLSYGVDGWPGRGKVTATGLPGMVNLLVPIESLTPTPVPTEPDDFYVGCTVKVADLLAAVSPPPAVGLTVEAVADAVKATEKDMADRFMWAVTTGPNHPDATPEKAVEEIIKPLVEKLSGGPEPAATEGEETSSGQ